MFSNDRLLSIQIASAWRVSQIAKSDYLLRHFCLSVCPSAWKNWAITCRIFVQYDIWIFLENLSRNFKLHWYMTRITRSLHEDVCTVMIVGSSVLLRIRNVSDNSCRENQNIFYINNVYSNMEIIMRWCGKIGYSRTGHNQNVIWLRKYARCMLDKLRLQTHPRNT